MALDLDKIRALADRVAVTHALDVVEVEYAGNPKQRLLRVYIEKDAATRARLAHAVESGASNPPVQSSTDRLAGITLEDCQAFSEDFGPVLDVEDLIPGAAYTLEVSSPGLDRKLRNHEEFQRFIGSLVKLRTVEPVEGNAHWQGRIARVGDEVLELDVSVPGRKKNTGRKRNKEREPAAASVTIAFSNILKANLVPEI